MELSENMEVALNLFFSGRDVLLSGTRPLIGRQLIVSQGGSPLSL